MGDKIKARTKAVLTFLVLILLNFPILSGVIANKAQTESDLLQYIKVYEAGNTSCITVKNQQQEGTALKKSYQQYLQQEKQKKDKKIEYVLGMANLYALGTNGSLQDALFYFNKSAEAGYAPAMYQLSLILLNGGVKNNKTNSDIESAWKKAVYWLLRAAKKNNTNSKILLSNLYHEGKKTSVLMRDNKKAFAFADMAAKNKNPRALSNLGDFYYSGIYVQKNYSIALQYYKKAALSSNLSMPLKKFYIQRISYMYKNGLGVKPNKKAAEEWGKKYKAQSQNVSCVIQ